MYTNKKPKSNVFQTKGCRLVMYMDQEPQNLFETQVETDACTQQGAIIQTCSIKGAETVSCTQTQNHSPNVFETQGWKLIRVRKQGPTIHTSVKRCLYTTKHHNQTCLIKGL